MKIAISPFSAQQGMIILPLRAILARMYVRHMGKSPHKCSVGVHWDGSLIPASACSQMQQTKIRGSYVVCLWEVTG